MTMSSGGQPADMLIEAATERRHLGRSRSRVHVLDNTTDDERSTHKHTNLKGFDEDEGADYSIVPATNSEHETDQGAVPAQREVEMLQLKTICNISGIHYRSLTKTMNT